MSFDTKGWGLEFDQFERKTIRKAVIGALNRTASVGHLAVQDEMEAKLDRVTPFAKRGVAYEQASSSNLSVSVIITGKPWVKNSRAPANFLTP